MQSFLPLKTALTPLCFDPALDQTPAELHAYETLYSLDDVPAMHRIGTVSSGPYRLAVQYWLPAQAHRTVLVTHGYYDHLGLYGHVIRYFVARGYAVLGFDLPGHGLSSGSRAEIASFDEYGRAICDVVDAAGRCLPPVTLGFGQSTGCAALLNFLMSGFHSPLQELILFAPLLRPHHWARSGRWTYALLHRWIKTLPRAFRANSGDRAFLHFCRKTDPLQPRLLSVSWVTAMKDWLARFAAQTAVELPTLIVQGQQDDTVDWRYNIPHIMAKLPQARLHYIAEARHHLANESPAIRKHLWQIVDDYLHIQPDNKTLT